MLGLASTLLGCGIKGRNTRHPGDVTPGKSLVGGELGKVDAKAVSHTEGPFEVEPGCHFLVNRTRWARGDATQGYLEMTLPEVEFAVIATPGNAYMLRVNVQQTSTDRANFEIFVEELDAEGNVLEKITPGGNC